MSLEFRFAVASDLHIALPHTIWDNPYRFHLVEVSIPALELIFQHLAQLDLDFLLLPGDLTQHGERENHAWLEQRLAQLPFPVYVVPGNHDVPVFRGDEKTISWADFPSYYQKFGYDNPKQLYYTCEILPGVRLIGLNSNNFHEKGDQIGRLDDTQLEWLKGVLATAKEELILVMIHHNVVEHLPGQSQHKMGRRYMLENAPQLLEILRPKVQLVFTGHLHVQDIAEDRGIYDITTGSLVSYPHPYRILHFRADELGRKWLQVESHRIDSLPEWPNLPNFSREWMGDRSLQFMLRLLTEPPLSLPLETARELAPSLRYFWADIAAGDGMFDYPNFPPKARRFFQNFSATGSDRTPAMIDNYATLLL
ncbi:metallophosphoesterase family protein [Floridanema aerugineum]|uniref:Metallophosphoesterase n=1 Tax=Floridaenema aerugineum BLCC-F46 TaxID=3153654 RepID=A0ABV4XEC6_9CYAN